MKHIVLPFAIASTTFALPAYASDFSGIAAYAATPIMVIAAILYGALAMSGRVHRYIYRTAIAVSIPLALIGFVAAADGLANLGTHFAIYSYAYYLSLTAAIAAFIKMIRRHGAPPAER